MHQDATHARAAPAPQVRPPAVGGAPRAASGLRGLWRRRAGGMRVSTRLLLIIATCLLPTVGLQVAVGWSQWAERKAQLGDLSRQQAQLLAGNVESVAETARVLLGAAAEFRQVRTAGPDCPDRLSGLLRNAPGFVLIASLDAEGRVLCASDPATEAEEGAPWTRDAAAATAFGAGRFARMPGHPSGVLPFHLPLAPSAGHGGGVLVAALDLGWLEGYLKRLKRQGSPFLASGVLTVTDADGVVLGRDLRHDEFVGRPVPASAAPMLRDARPGILRIESIDGTHRVVGYVPPTPSSSGLAVAVGFHEPDLMQDVENATMQGALLLGAVSLAVFGLTLVVARRFIAAPTQALLDTATRWREGDLSARAPELDRGSEFGQIAAAYNAMAAALQRREEELRGHAGALEARVAQRTRELTLANERLRIEVAERRNAEAALRQAQKMEAVGQLAGGIAHDFNNVLQAVLGGVGLIRRRAGDPPAVERLAGMVEDAARRGQSVTRRLLAFARRGELRAEALEIGELLGGMREVLAATLGAAVRVEAEAPPGLPPVLADRGQLETVLVNLATNARDAMPRGGTLTLSAAPERVGPAPADAAGRRPPGPRAPGDYVRLVVADTGEGMDAATLARAAEPFFTTKPLGQGTGLGLAMARSFAEGSGGAFAIGSEEGRGTRVSLWLPVAPGRAAAPVGREGSSPKAGGAAPAAPATAREAAAAAAAPRAGAPVAACPNPARGCPRVLLVDDEPTVRETLVAQLRDEGFEVAEAADGASALERLGGGGGAGGPPAVDVLVTDLAMPGMDGVALIREAQRRRRGLPAILITGYAGDAATLAVGQAVGGGTFTLVRKPVTGAELADRVAALLAAGAERRSSAPAPEPV
jgi:signal transduction histidine kinase/CheY-like chemotaxis protein